MVLAVIIILLTITVAAVLLSALTEPVLVVITVVEGASVFDPTSGSPMPQRKSRKRYEARKGKSRSR